MSCFLLLCGSEIKYDVIHISRMRCSWKWFWSDSLWSGVPDFEVIKHSTSPSCILGVVQYHFDMTSAVSVCLYGSLCSLKLLIMHLFWCSLLNQAPAPLNKDMRIQRLRALQYIFYRYCDDNMCNKRIAKDCNTLHNQQSFFYSLMPTSTSSKTAWMAAERFYIDSVPCWVPLSKQSLWSAGWHGHSKYSWVLKVQRCVISLWAQRICTFCIKCFSWLQRVLHGMQPGSHLALL